MMTSRPRSDSRALRQSCEPSGQCSAPRLGPERNLRANRYCRKRNCTAVPIDKTPPKSRSVKRGNPSGFSPAELCRRSLGQIRIRPGNKLWPVPELVLALRANPAAAVRTASTVVISALMQFPSADRAFDLLQPSFQQIDGSSASLISRDIPPVMRFTQISRGFHSLFCQSHLRSQHPPHGIAADCGVPDLAANSDDLIFPAKPATVAR